MFMIKNHILDVKIEQGGNNFDYSYCFFIKKGLIGKIKIRKDAIDRIDKSQEKMIVEEFINPISRRKVILDNIKEYCFTHLNEIEYNKKINFVWKLVAEKEKTIYLNPKYIGWFLWNIKRDANYFISNAKYWEETNILFFFDNGEIIAGFMPLFMPLRIR